MLYRFEAVMGWMLPQSPGSDRGDTVRGNGRRVPRSRAGELGPTPAPFFSGQGPDLVFHAQPCSPL